jgi:hypothetical protein
LRRWHVDYACRGDGDARADWLNVVPLVILSLFV